MDVLRSLDAASFRFINLGLSNSFFDWLLPFFSWNSFFVPALILGAVLLAWKGGIHGRIFIAVLLLALVLGDSVFCNSIKHAVGRPRPFQSFPDAHLLVGRGKSASMPSAHTTNWFAAVGVVYFFYRRSLWAVLPLALLIAFSRVYLGAHYPSDVLVGAVLGLSTAAALVWALETLWRRAGRRLFPIWWSGFPSIFGRTKIQPDPAKASGAGEQMDVHDKQWLRLGYLLIGLLLLVRLAYLAGGIIELSEDEAYQWQWSKHLALSYYSKPPLIAYTQWLGTALWGDTAFGIRFFSPVIAAAISAIFLRFIACQTNARAAFLFFLMLSALPLMAVGATLLTIDSLSVLFWTAAIVTGWRALENDSTAAWRLTGVWMGLGFLSKYTALIQLACWIVFFVLWPEARRQLRRPGPYWAVAIMALFTIPVIVWNASHGWITVTHLANRGGLDQRWEPSLRFFWDFLIQEILLLNPIFFLGMLWALGGVIPRLRQNKFLAYLFSMGVPLFLFYLLYTFRARVQPNWVAPAVLPLFAVALLYWREFETRRTRSLRWVYGTGVVLGLIAITLLHETRWVAKIANHPLPADKDPLVRVRGWSAAARLVGDTRAELLKEGKPVFIIADHYGLTSLVSFYLPEAKAGVPDQPLVYCLLTSFPRNQYYFWENYSGRRGQNAVFVQAAETRKPIPPALAAQFRTVTDLGLRTVPAGGNSFHQFQLFACRGLK